MDIFDLFTNGVANITVIVNSSLDQAIHIDGDNTLRASSHAASTKCITEGIVAHFIAQTAAGCQRVHTIGTIDKEAVALRKHFGSVVSPFLIDIISAIIQQVQSLDREGEDLLQTLLIQPFHKALLQPGHRLPLHFCAIWEYEIREHTIKIRLVEVCAVPEDGLEITSSGRLIQRIDDLLKLVSNNLVDTAMTIGKINYLICVQVIIVAIVLADEVIKIRDELRGGDCTGKLRCNGKAQVDKFTAEGIKVVRSR